MKKISAIIVDDESDSRETLAHFLAKYCQDVRIVAQVENIVETQKAIKLHEPKLVFLDIEMPFGNAFDLLEQLDAINFEIIFITAFSQYAVQAFNLSAVHYILKPIDIDELAEAVEKAKKRIIKKENINYSKILLENLSALNSQNRKVVLPLIDGFEVVKLNEILFCEAQDNFTKVYLKDGSNSLICRKLKFYETALTDHGFCRVHRSFLVNLEYIKRYKKGKGGAVILENGKEIQVSNSRKQEFLERFK